MSKPPGWVLSRRGGSPSVGSVLSASLGTDSLYFPFEVDRRIWAVGIVCTDRGMNSQFEKFKEFEEIEYFYKIKNEIIQTNKLIKKLEIDENSKICLFKIKFPDPFNPRTDEITVSIPDDIS